MKNALELLSVVCAPLALGLAPTTVGNICGTPGCVGLLQLGLELSMHVLPSAGVLCCKGRWSNCHGSMCHAVALHCAYTHSPTDRREQVGREHKKSSRAQHSCQAKEHSRNPTMTKPRWSAHDKLAPVNVKFANQ